MSPFRGTGLVPGLAGLQGNPNYRIAIGPPLHHQFLLKEETTLSPRPLDPNRPALEESILVTAARLFAGRGYSATSIQDIADAVGLQKSSLYHYVPGKEQLLFDALIHCMNISLVPIEKALASADSPREKLRQVVRVTVLNVLERNFAVTLFVGDRRFMSLEHLDQYVAYRDRYEGIFRQVVDEGIADGQFQCTDPSLMVKAILGICNWVVQWYSPSGRLSGAQIAEYYSDLVVDRLLSQPSTEIAGQFTGGLPMTP